MPDLRDIMGSAMLDLKGWVEAGMVQRGKNASGETMAGVTTSVVQGPGFIEGRLEADGHWRFVGSGRRPGGQPPVDELRLWAEAKGVDIDAWAMAKSIEMHGSRDFRQHNSNIFLDAGEAWQRLDMPRIESEFADVISGQTVEIFTNTIGRN